jgi:dTMP kinase
MVMSKRGMFVVVEGPDGVGKSTTARRLASEMGAFYTYEPTDWLIPRLALASWGDYSWRERALLFAADRALHLHDVIRPALEGGNTVVCDRYELSFFVYQMVDAGHGAALTNAASGDRRLLRELSCDNLAPDVVLLLQLDPAEITQRIATRGDPLSYYEQPDRQRRVLDVYENEAIYLARGDVMRVHATGTPDDVVRTCRLQIERHCGIA